MNPRPRSLFRRLAFLVHGSALIVFLSSFMVPRSSLSGMPQPMVVYYGQAKDAFGWPYRSGADVVLLSATNEVARHAIDGSLTPGVNFLLQVPIDDGRDSTRYIGTAMRTGETVAMVVRDSLGQKTIMESNAVPAVPAAGEIVLVNVTAGEDTDGDGLSDDWERELMAWLNDPAYGSLDDIHPDDDADGDGQSNGDEYHAGTFAFLDYDFFFAEMFRQTGNDRYYIEFLSTPGKVYRIEEAEIDVVEGGYDWASCAYALTETGGWQEGPVEGDGGWIRFYVSKPDTDQVWRLVVR